MIANSIRRIFIPPRRRWAKHNTRTECWPRYFIINFVMSRSHTPQDIPYELVSRCGNRYVPEYIPSKEGDRCNPFPTNIFCSESIWSNISLLLPPLRQFVVPFVEDVSQVGPSSRPAVSEVVRRF
ncbi:hypothetical protein F5146DRAFT_1187260, partial [Armillaria mellea]